MCTAPFTPQRGKQRLQAEDGDKRTEREKLLSELRTLRDGAKGPMNIEALEAKVAECAGRALSGAGGAQALVALQRPAGQERHSLALLSRQRGDGRCACGPQRRSRAPPCETARRLEFKLTHESLSAMDEKRLREQKERLERTERPNAVRASALSARLDAIKAESNELRGLVAEIDKKVRCSGAHLGHAHPLGHPRPVEVQAACSPALPVPNCPCARTAQPLPPSWTRSRPSARRWRRSWTRCAPRSRRRAATCRG